MSEYGINEEVAKTSKKTMQATGRAAQKIVAKKAMKKGGATAGAAVGGPAGAVLGYIASSKIGRYILIGVLCMIIITPVIVMALPSVVWNLMFHTNEDADPVAEKKVEMALGKDAMQEREEEYAEVVMDALESSGVDVYDEIEKHCKDNGVDYEASQSNIVNSTDFLGNEKAADSGKKFQTQQAVYNKFRARGYSVNAAISCVGAARYLTGCDPEYSDKNYGTLEQDKKTEAIITEKKVYGMFKFEKTNYESWIKGQNKGAGDSKIATLMADPQNQVLYFDYAIKKSLSKSEYKKLIAGTDYKECTKLICSNLSILKNAKQASINSLAETFKGEHEISESDTGNASSSDKATSSSSSALDAAQSELSKIKAKSGYNQKEIDGIKKEVLKKYKSKKKTVDYGYKYFLDKGYSPAAAAGMLGNSYVESGGWCPNASDGIAHGLFQWQGGRYPAMTKYVGSGWKTNYKKQFEYIDYEMTKGSESSSFSSYKSNVATRATSFLPTTTVNSLKGFKANNNIAVTTLNFCACIERCAESPKYSHIIRRYAASEVVLEQCANITADAEADYTNVGAGTRQMALILSAFSVKQDQMFPQKKQIKTVENVSDVVDKVLDSDAVDSKFDDSGKGDKGKNDKVDDKTDKAKDTITEVVMMANTYWKNHTFKESLRSYMMGAGTKMFKVSYGDIIINDDGKKVYALISIEPAPTKDILSIFNMKPTDKYENGGKHVTVLQATKSGADTHMEMLYGNHDVGLGGGSSIGSVGNGKLGNPLGTFKLTDSVITTKFHEYRPWSKYEKYHNGIDIGASTGTKVYAAESGKVTTAGVYGGYGNCIKIKCSGGMILTYGHLSAINVHTGQTVNRGQHIGAVGNTGYSFGSHLHFEVTVNGKEVDPLLYIKKSK